MVHCFSSLLNNFPAKRLNKNKFGFKTIRLKIARVIYHRDGVLEPSQEQGTSFDKLALRKSYSKDRLCLLNIITCSKITNHCIDLVFVSHSV